MVLHRVPAVMLPLCCCPLYFLATNGWGEDVTQLEEVVVTGPPLPAAGALNLDEPSQVGSRLDVPIKDLPASVEIINQATIQKQGNRTILEAIERAAGMSNITTPGGGAAVFSSRGFSGNNAVMQLYNGTRFYVGAETFTTSSGMTTAFS